MEELEQYRATAALNAAGVNLYEENKRYKDRNERLNRRLSVATTERDNLKKELGQYKTTLNKFQDFLNKELEMSEFVSIPTLIQYIESIKKVAKK